MSPEGEPREQRLVLRLRKELYLSRSALVGHVPRVVELIRGVQVVTAY